MSNISKSSGIATSSGKPMQSSVSYIAQKTMYTDLHGFATRGTKLESGQFRFNCDFLK